ncbi:MAG TPA: hypothetical protein VHZ73_06260 [Vicinamibacterales bacterium]|nr:hypothetical protein [Vicinamibacterales bacterium]
MLRTLLFSALALSLCTPRASAELVPDAQVYSARVASRIFLATRGACSADVAAGAPAEQDPPLRGLEHVAFQDDGQPLHGAAVEHSVAYHTRAKIHKIASFATIPLFAAEVALGQSIYNTANVSNGNKSAHIAVGTGIMTLFGVNTITGAWNLLGEDRQDPKGRGLRLVHAILMMAADAGFVATAATGPQGNRRVALTVPTGESTHRAIAFSSIGVGTVGYLLMLLGSH